MSMTCTAEQGNAIKCIVERGEERRGEGRVEGRVHFGYRHLPENKLQWWVV